MLSFLLQSEIQLSNPAIDEFTKVLKVDIGIESVNKLSREEINHFAVSIMILIITQYKIKKLSL